MSDFFNRFNSNYTQDEEDNIIYRPEPERQEVDNVQPWFVDEDPSNKKNISGEAKKLTKRTVSIMASIVGLTAMISLIAYVLLLVLGMYE